MLGSVCMGITRCLHGYDDILALSDLGARSNTDAYEPTSTFN
jgi:hypothetical protein